MIGQMVAADFSTRERHPATITAAVDGTMAVIAFGELKSEIRKNPQEVSWRFQVLSLVYVTDFQNNASRNEERYGDLVLQCSWRRTKPCNQTCCKRPNDQETQRLLLQKSVDEGILTGR